MSTVFSKAKRFRVIFILAILDAICICGSYFFALWLRHDFDLSAIPENYINTYFNVIWIWVIVCFTVFAIMRLYNSIVTFY